MHALGESLRLKQFIKYDLTPVALYAAGMTEHTCKFIGTLLGCGTLAHHILGLGLYLTAYGGLLESVLLHGLFHLVNGLLERIHYLAYTGVAGCGKLLLTALEHLLGG